MASYKNYLIAFLSLTTVAGAYLAWHQSREVSGLRQTAAATENQSELRKRVWDAEKRVQSLESQLASAREAKPAGAATPTAPAPADAPNRRAPEAFLKMLENPEYQKLMAIQQRAMLDSRYAALFKKLKLSPRQLEQFKHLLVEWQASMMDLMPAARAQGLDPRTDPEAFRQLAASIRSEIDENIKTTLGENAYSEYRDFEKTASYRHVVTQLEQRLSYGGTPLGETQNQQLLQIIAETNKPAAGNASATAPGNVVAIAGGGGGGTLINDEVIARASTLLAPDQVDALREIQQEQQAGVQMGRLVREQMGETRIAPGQSVTMPASIFPRR